MSRKSKRRSDTQRDSPPARLFPFDLFTIVPVCALGLYFVRFFVPAESAHLGETLWIVQFWLLLATFVTFRKWRFREEFTFDRRDLAVWLLVLGHVLGALYVICTDGHKRAATNMLWEWVGMGVAFSMLKESIGQPEGMRRLLTGLVIVLVVLAGFGLWQHYVWYPEQRALLLEFEQLPPGSPRYFELAEQLGPLATAGDPVAAYVLRNRLMASTEPIGRFALANTLGGLLAAGLVLLCGALANAVRGGRAIRNTVLLAVAAFLVGYCLLLTKSRTAWVGLLAGAAVWGSLSFGRRLLQRRTALIGGGLVAGVVVLAAVVTTAGGLDRQVLTEAPKALKYRLEYWTGTWGVIGEQPLAGIGPGNFRQHYLRHKLPESSEEILDPHNLFLDVWANGGVIGLIGLLLVLFFSWRGNSRSDKDDAVPDTTVDGILAAAGIFACILLLAPDVILGVNRQLAVLAMAMFAVGLVVRLTDTRFCFTAVAMYGAAVVLLVHLLGQGGIAMPVVCLTLLLLLLPAPAGCANRIPPQLQRYVGPTAAVATCLATISCGLTATRPVIAARALINVGQYEAARFNVRAAREQVQAAAAADPLDPEPWQALAELDFRDWQAATPPDGADFDRAMEHLSEAIARDPHHPKRYWTAGQWEAARFERTRDPEAAELAVEWLARAVDGYPGSSRIWADYALALAAAGRSEAARMEAARALELDALNIDLQHYDKVLDDGTRERLRELM